MEDSAGSWSRSAYMLIGRYALFDELAHGGMATVHVGRLMGPSGFARTVAIKRLHARLAKDQEFVAMFLDEARLAARLRHPNVVPIHDVVQTEDELFLVMDYVEGESLARLLKLAADLGEPLPLDMGAAIVAGALHGLHAAHEAKGDDGQPLELVHRDVSPENILVGVNGVPRILDFGIAKAAGRVSTTAEGKVKGKLAYMAMEQLAGEEVDRRVDVFSTGVVLWEVLAGRPRFRAPSQTALLAMALEGKLVAPSELRPSISPELDALVLRAMARDPAQRFATAREFAFALEELVPLASPARVGAWVEQHAGETLSLRASLIANVEKSQSDPGLASNPFDDSQRGVTVISSPGSSRPDDAFAATALIDTHGDREQLTLADGLSVEPDEREPNRRALVAVAVLLLSVLGLVFWVSMRGDSTDPAAASSSAATVTAPTVSDGELRPTPSPEPSATTATAAATASAGVTEPSATASATSAPRVRPRPRPQTPPPKPVGKPAKPNCNPPYTMDARGVQRIKPECL